MFKYGFIICDHSLNLKIFRFYGDTKTTRRKFNSVFPNTRTLLVGALMIKIECYLTFFFNIVSIAIMLCEWEAILALHVEDPKQSDIANVAENSEVSDIRIQVRSNDSSKLISMDREWKKEIQNG